MEHSTAMTIEFLRARLLSERSVSRTARQRADELAQRVQLEFIFPFLFFFSGGAGAGLRTILPCFSYITVIKSKLVYQLGSRTGGTAKDRVSSKNEG